MGGMGGKSHKNENKPRWPPQKPKSSNIEETIER